MCLAVHELDNSHGEEAIEEQVQQAIAFLLKGLIFVIKQGKKLGAELLRKTRSAMLLIGIAFCLGLALYFTVIGSLLTGVGNDGRKDGALASVLLSVGPTIISFGSTLLYNICNSVSIHQKVHAQWPWSDRQTLNAWACRTAKSFTTSPINIGTYMFATLLATLYNEHYQPHDPISYATVIAATLGITNSGTAILTTRLATPRITIKPTVSQTVTSGDQEGLDNIWEELSPQTGEPHKLRGMLDSVLYTRTFADIGECALMAIVPLGGEDSHSAQ